MVRFGKYVLALVAAAGLSAAAQAVTILAASNGSLIATYQGGGAGFTLALGVSINGAAPASYQLTNSSSTAGVSSFDFGPVSAGDALDFVLNVNSGSYFLHTKDNLNPGGATQASVSPILGGLAIGFDDTVGGAGYSDYTFTVGNARIGTVPEAATWGMMVFGFGALGGAMRRRRATAFA